MLLNFAAQCSTTKVQKSEGSELNGTRHFPLSAGDAHLLDENINIAVKVLQRELVYYLEA